MTFKGIFELVTANDLLTKLEHDFLRVKNNPLDSYAAFDFFITAHHLPEWVYPGDEHKPKRKTLERNSPLLQIASHLADGSKHFEATSAKHRSVAETIRHEGAFQADAFQANAFDIDELRVQLEQAAAVDFGASIGVVELAKRLVEFWRLHLGRSSDG